MNTLLTKRTKELIYEALSNTGQWYKVPEGIPLCPYKFVKYFGWRFSERLNTLIKENVKHIQRTGDRITIELKTV